jgi:hypothetical protein
LAFCSEEERTPTRGGLFRNEAKNALMRARQPSAHLIVCRHRSVDGRIGFDDGYLDLMTVIWSPYQTDGMVCLSH